MPQRLRENDPDVKSNRKATIIKTKAKEQGAATQLDSG